MKSSDQGPELDADLYPGTDPRLCPFLFGLGGVSSGGVFDRKDTERDVKGMIHIL